MASMNVEFGIVFLVQMIIGTTGNFFLLSQYLFLSFTGSKLRSTDLILRHLTVANTMLMLSRGIPEIMTAFGLKDFLSDVGCKLVFYVHRVGRGVSMGCTCLMTVFQAIAISPSDWKWKNLKGKSLEYLTPSTVLCWALHLLLNVIVLMNVAANQKNKTITHKTDFGYCYGKGFEKVSVSIIVALLAINDTLCIVLLLCASGSMVFILYTHKRRVQYIHRKNISSRSSPETRTTYSILILVCIYVIFYAITCTMQISLTIVYNSSSLFFAVSALMNSCFPTVCPFLLISRDQTLSRVYGIYHRRNM